MVNPVLANPLYEPRGLEVAQGLVEYGLVIAFVSLVAVLGLIWMGPAVGSMYSSASMSV